MKTKALLRKNRTFPECLMQETESVAFPLKFK